MMDSIELIAEERTRQQEKHRYTEEHDDQHVMGELARAGICYADKAVSEIEGSSIDWPHPFWPDGWKVGDEGSSIAYLVKAAALIAAEIDRLLRLASGVNR